MTEKRFLSLLEDTALPVPEDALAAFEASIGARLPEEYRSFLLRCNGGRPREHCWFEGPKPDGERGDAGVKEIGGVGTEWGRSLESMRKCYLGRIPAALIWIIRDHFGNAICLGIHGEYHGRLYFWSHEEEPDEEEDGWDGGVETAGNVMLLANSFREFVRGLRSERRFRENG